LQFKIFYLLENEFYISINLRQAKLVFLAWLSVDFLPVFYENAIRLRTKIEHVVFIKIKFTEVCRRN